MSETSIGLMGIIVGFIIGYAWGSTSLIPGVGRFRRTSTDNKETANG
jgi:hypothetical protein